MQADQYNKAELARFEDELARKRADVEHEKQRARQVELVRYATLFVHSKSIMRRATNPESSHHIWKACFEHEICMQLHRCRAWKAAKAPD